MILKIGVIVLLCTAFTVHGLTTTPLDEQRQKFALWQNSYDHLAPLTQQQLLAELADYPLYPYAQYQYLQANIKTITVEEISAFLSDHPTFLLSDSLRQQWVTELTRRQAWSQITTFKLDNTVASQCRYQYALLQQGREKEAFAPLQEIWLTGKELPAACDDLLAAWSKSGQKTANLILLRIEQVLADNNLKLARLLTTQLPDSHKTIKAALLALFADPQKLQEFNQKITPTDFSRQVVLASFDRLARADVTRAQQLLPQLVKQQQLTLTQETQLKIRLAWRFFNNDTASDEQLQWRDQFIWLSKEPTLVERRIREGLTKGNLVEVATWLNVLNQTDRNKDEWRYWRAQILLREKQTEQANQLLNELAQGRGYYPLLSAQKLAIPAKLVLNQGHRSQLTDKSLIDKYDPDPTLRRIRELKFQNMDSEAKREWRYYLYQTGNQPYAELARYSYLKGWGELAIQATIAGKLWDDWVERLPVVNRALYQQALADKQISLSYALAISRQESALDTDAQSPAGARGLMQLMPATASETAKKIGLVNYRSASQLFDPQINIALGTAYLDGVYQQFNNNRVLASAAYNAGPRRVQQWLQTSAGQLNIDAFIESIPFTETRNYVKNVLVYDYIYRMILSGTADTLLTTSEFTPLY